MPEAKKIAADLNRIFLNLSNPRHDPYETEDKAIEYLCNKENVYNLARDIHKHGLNPLERFAVIPTEKLKRGAGPANYYAAEGNRRLCALKLLNDPDSAPAGLRKELQKLSETWAPILTVDAVVFNSLEEVRIWLDRIYNGPQGGIGRKDWNAEQKQRFSGGSKNRAAQALLDYAEQEQMITQEERKGKLTTIQRFVGNDVFREVIGLDQSDPDEIARIRPKTEFDILVRRFMRDVVGKEAANSRMNKDEIIKYARPLGSISGVTTARIEAEGLSVPSGAGKGKRQRKTPSKPQKAKHVTYEQEIHDALKHLGNEKLQSLYYSITSIELEYHTPIVCIGAWAFFDTLTACAGRLDAMSFEAFLGDYNLDKPSAIGRMGAFFGAAPCRSKPTPICSPTKPRQSHLLKA